jgi:hypothetical protein
VAAAGARLRKAEGALRFAVRAGLSPVYRWAWVRTQPLDHPLDEPGEPPSSLELRWATEADIPALIALRRQYRPGTVRARLAAGQTCLLSLVDGQVASVRWMNAATMDVEYLGLALPLMDDEICVYEVYARPAHFRMAFPSIMCPLHANGAFYCH